MLLKEELDEYHLSDCMNDFEDNSVGGGKVRIETTPQIKQDVPINDIKDSKQKVKEWLKTVSFKGKETGEGKENDRSKHFPQKDFSHCPSF